MKTMVKLPAILGIIVFLLIRLSYAQNSIQDYLNAHNAARNQVGVGNLIWDDRVAAYAQNYANMRTDCALIHSQGPYGENIAYGTGLTALDAINLWVGEQPLYNYYLNTCIGGECLHYTQVVWRDSVRVGCARVACYNDMWFVICNYDPPGNIIGQRPY